MFAKLLLIFILIGCASEPQRQVASDCTDRHCGEFTTCNEAVHELLSCGRKELDRDNDGIPCEEKCINYGR